MIGGKDKFLVKKSLYFTFVSILLLSLRKNNVGTEMNEQKFGKFT